MEDSEKKRGREKGEVDGCNRTRPIIGSKPGLPGLKRQEGEVEGLTHRVPARPNTPACAWGPGRLLQGHAPSLLLVPRIT